ncbi:MAG: J domain-containing protein [Candidatus Daviesbacteria bacterium]|nr:J domain-containing protein [Candidatus Daviesbacteria bacterium]
MEQIEVNGKKIYLKPSSSTFKKSAFTIAQEIYKDFSRIGITLPFITLTLPRNPLKAGEKAEISWVVNGKDHYYQCATQTNYRDNLGCIGKVISQDCYAIRNGMKSFGQVMKQFQLGYGEEKTEFRTPEQILGIPPNVTDPEFIKFRYKTLVKMYHPDNTETGDKQKFQEVQDAFESMGGI